MFAGARTAVVEEQGDSFVRSLARGFAVLRAFRPDHPQMTITEVATVCDLTRAGARRMLLTLQSLGYVGLNGRHFHLTGRVRELGEGFLAHPLWETTRTVLQTTANTINETVSAGVLSGFNVIYALRVRSIRKLHLELRAGAHLPAHVSSMGRVLLASLPPHRIESYIRHTQFTKFTRFTVDNPDVLRTHLAETRERGWTCVRGEIDEGITCIAVPLTSPEGMTPTALNVGLTTARATPEFVERTIVPALQDAAATITRILQTA